MSFKIIIEPSGHEFTSKAGETILDAAERQGVVLPYGCRNGLCGSCAGNLLSGEVHYPDEQVAASLEARPDKNCLPCQAVAVSDLTVQIHEVETEKEIEVRSLTCEVMRMEPLAHDVMGIYLKLPEDQRLQFLAGQYLDFIMPDGRRRAFSIASCPSLEDEIELHIRHVDGGDFTGFVFDDLKERDILRLEGPQGNFFVRNDQPERPMIMLGGGTGFAPLKSMIENLLEQGDRREIHLYWGTRTSEEMYLDELPAGWASQHEHIHYHRAISEPVSSELAGCFKGFVHEAVIADFPDLSAHDVYMSGPPAMIDACEEMLAELGVDPENVMYDEFG